MPWHCNWQCSTYWFCIFCFHQLLHQAAGVLYVFPAIISFLVKDNLPVTFLSQRLSFVVAAISFARRKVCFLVSMWKIPIVIANAPNSCKIDQSDSTPWG